MGNRFNPATLSNKTHNFVRFLKMKNKKFLCFCFTFHIASDFSTQFWIYIKHHYNFHQISAWVSKLVILINSCNLVICLCFSPRWWHFSNERVETRFLNLNKNDGKKNRLVNWDRTYQETGLKIRIKWGYKEETTELGTQFVYVWLWFLRLGWGHVNPNQDNLFWKSPYVRARSSDTTDPTLDGQNPSKSCTSYVESEYPMTPRFEPSQYPNWLVGFIKLQFLVGDSEILHQQLFRFSLRRGSSNGLEILPDGTVAWPEQRHQYSSPKIMEFLWLIRIHSIQGRWKKDTGSKQTLMKKEWSDSYIAKVLKMVQNRFKKSINLVNQSGLEQPNARWIGGTHGKNGL